MARIGYYGPYRGRIAMAPHIKLRNTLMYSALLFLGFGKGLVSRAVSSALPQKADAKTDSRVVVGQSVPVPERKGIPQCAIAKAPLSTTAPIPDCAGACSGACSNCAGSGCSGGGGSCGGCGGSCGGSGFTSCLAGNSCNCSSCVCSNCNGVA